jgi:hypothetical protein
MQATIFRRARDGQNPFVLLALVAGLTIGAFGGYSINGLMRPLATASSVVHTPTSVSDTDLALSAARHAATERADALDGTDLAASMARHASSERADAWAGYGVSP